MPGPPIFTLRDAELGFGGASLFSEVGFGIARGDRACLIGRNGCGKSTLMKVVAGELELDLGERYAQPGIRIAYLHQDPPGDAEALVRGLCEPPAGRRTARARPRRCGNDGPAGSRPGAAHGDPFGG